MLKWSHALNCNSVKDKLGQPTEYNPCQKAIQSVPEGHTYSSVGSHGVQNYGNKICVCMFIYICIYKKHIIVMVCKIFFGGGRGGGGGVKFW